MNPNFGEIILDPISRCFFDDYEDESLNNQFIPPQIKWETDDGKVPEEINHFIIVEGLNAKKLLQNASILTKDSKLICSIRKKNVEVYGIDGSTIICVAEEQDLNYAASISDCLNEFINKAKEVTAVALQRLSEFKSDKLPEECIIRGLNSKFSDIEALNTPNFVTGISAGIGTLRTISDTSFSCYIIYVDIYDEISIKKILNHLKRLGIKYDESVKIKPFHLNNTNLYL